MTPHNCDMNIVRGADWCKANPLRWTDRKCCGRNMFGPTLQEAYDSWVASGRVAQVDAHKEAYLGYLQALVLGTRHLAISQRADR